MRTIEIDFDVFKELTMRRETEDITENDVLRELLGLGPRRESKTPREPVGAPWISKGVAFPHGTEFRAIYKGQNYFAKVEDGSLVLNGERHTSPSSAAVAITNNPVNGWIFWECKMPGKAVWVQIKTLRKS